ncbi:MAG: cytidine deaminase [Chloroflexi bacterium]|jgi:dCMP deaminase|nr:cytidine deaminase [Chloroflexota bacterium]
MEVKRERRDKVNYYLDMAEVVGKRSTCIRKHYGAVIVKHDEVVSTGYNGAPRGRKNCIDLGVCRREQLNVPRGTRYEMCRSVHAEQNAIISASRERMLGSSLYMTGIDLRDNDNYVEKAMPCSMCKRVIINAGIETVYIRDTQDEYRKVDVQEWIDNDDSLAAAYGY